MIDGFVAQRLEELRQSFLVYKKKASFFSKASVVLLLLSIVIAVVFKSVLNPVITIVIGVVVTVLADSPCKSYNKKAAECEAEFKTLYKSEFGRAILYESLEDVEYIENQGFSEKMVNSFDVVSWGNRFSSEDYLKAKYRGITFEQSDVTIRHKSKDSAARTVFKGRVMKFSYPKTVKDVRICSRKTVVINLGSGSEYSSKHVVTEDVDFNNKLDVWSKDQQEGFYLLTPRFMEVLKRLAEKYSYVCFHFKENELYLALETERDSFDCPMDTAVQYEVERARIEADIEETKSIIDALYMEDYN